MIIIQTEVKPNKTFEEKRTSTVFKANKEDCNIGSNLILLKISRQESIIFTRVFSIPYY